MVHGCGNTMIKFLFFTSNLLICIFGALIFGFSLWANMDKDFASKLQHLSDEIHRPDLNVLSKYQASLWVLVAVGALLFLVGFLGCCGALCESTLLLSLFFVIVLILTLIELGASIFAVASKSEFKESLRKLFGQISTKESMKNLQPIQDVFQCCGATPELKQEYINQGMCPGELARKDDCFTVVSEWIESTGEVVIVIAFVLLAIELFALISTCVLCRAFRERSPYFYA